MGNQPTTGRYRFVIGALILWANFAAGTSFLAISPLLPLIEKDYGIGHAIGGLLMGSVLIILAAFGLPGGIIVGRLGLWRTYTISYFMMGLLSLAALSPSFEGLLALRIAFGLGMAAMLPATGALVMQWFRPKELPVITSLTMAAVSLGMVVSAASSAPLAEVVGWERVLGIFGALGLAGAAAWIAWGRTSSAPGQPVVAIDWGEIKAVLRNRTILLLGLADASCFSMYMALSSWLPTYYHESRGMSLTEAGFIISLLPFMGIVAVLLGGFLTLAVRSRHLFFIVPGAVAASAGLATFLVDNTTAIYISVTILGLGAWIYLPTLMTIPMQLPGMKPERLAIVWGWMMVAPGIGGFISPLVVWGYGGRAGQLHPGIRAILGAGLVPGGGGLHAAQSHPIHGPRARSGGARPDTGARGHPLAK